MQGQKIKKQMKGKGVNLPDEDKSVCPWNVYISPSRDGKWVVKTFNNEHKCLQSRDIKACTSTFLAKHVADLISHNPEMPTVAIQEQMQSKFQVGVSITKAFRAKSK